MNASLATLASNDRDVYYADVYEHGRTAKIWEQGLVFVFLFCTFGPPPGLSPILYAATGAILGLTVLYYKTVVPVLLRSWILFTLPLFGLLSVTWADYSSSAMRSGFLQLLTPFVLVYFASRLNATQLLRLLTLAALATAIYAMLYYAQFSTGGPYPSKNVLAFRMQFAFLFALASALNPKELQWVRLICIPFIPLTFFIILQANSAGALTLSSVGAFGIITLRLLWNTAASIRNLRSIVVLSGITLALVVLTWLLNTPQTGFAEMFLGAVGKDSSLTGRTDIWAAAELISKENYWYGVGLDSFWQYDIGAAQTINEYGHKPPGTKFSFHSAFWEVRVHLGMIGLSLFILICTWVIARAFWNFFRNASMETSTFAVLAILALISAFTESYLWGTFRMSVNVFYLAALIGIGARRRKVATNVPVTITSSER